MDTSDIAKRMKDYESISKTKLMKRCPVICRIDGKCHHSFTRGFKKPFDEVYAKSMQDTAKYLCENLPGVVVSYQQSDEITLVFVDYEELNTSPYFNYEVQKLCSIIASMATMAFNKFFEDNVQDFGFDCCYDPDNDNFGDEAAKGREEDYAIYGHVYMNCLGKAMFDARCFNIPKEEVTNLIYWRQLDATRNSIQMWGQANFSHEELQNKSCNEIQDMLMTQKGINWNDLPIYQKRGSCCVKNRITVCTDGVMETAMLRDSSKSENEWIIDTEIPIFKGEGREYIDNLIFVGEE